MKGLPPTWIGVGALDLFVQEDMEFARRLMEAEVPTELHVVPGAYHGFDIFCAADESSPAIHGVVDQRAPTSTGAT